MAEARSLVPASTRPRAPRWAWLALLAVLLAIIAGAGLDSWRARRPAPEPATLSAGFGPATFPAALAGSERDVAEAQRQLALGPSEWLREEQLALALIARFRLAGDYADLAAAERLLDDGLARTPDPAGPVLSKSALEVLVHRLDAADAALARFARWGMPESADRADAVALAGDIALQRGRLGEAAAAFARARTLAPSRGIDLREALLAGQRGEHALAATALERLLAAPRQPPAALATLALQRANLAYAVGDWDGAGRWVAAANRLFPGYWLGEVYAAQQRALAGRSGEAIRAYRGIATRTGKPEVMDALAHLLRLEGQAAASRQWAARAAQGWETRRGLFPEAVAAHLAEHELAVGSVARALTLAGDDVARRPNGPSIALLARALILSGRPREALVWLDRAERQGWVSAGLLMLRADAAAELGDRAASDAARARAEAINPRATDPRARMVWFGHD